MWRRRGEIGWNGVTIYLMIGEWCGEWLGWIARWLGFILIVCRIVTRWRIDRRKRMNRKIRIMLDLRSYGRTIAHCKRREDDTWMGCEVDAPRDHHTTKIIPLSILNLRWMKDDSSWGRIERRIELGMRYGRENG